MTKLILSMPPALQSWVDARLAQGRYADAEEYLRDLIRRDQDGAADDTAWVRAMIDEGLASGVCEQDADVILGEMIAQLKHG